MPAFLSSLAAVLSANVGLAIVLALLLGGAFVFALLGLILRGSGASLRPIVFVAGFFAIVTLPQAVGHLALAVRPGPLPAIAESAPAAPPPAALPPGGRSEDWVALYRARMPGLATAPATAWPSGQSVARLSFASPEQAADGLMAYLTMHRVAPSLDRGGNEVRGTRGLGGGVVHLRRDGATLRIATALDDAALDALLQSLGAPPPVAAAHATAPEPLVPALQPAVRWMRAHVAAQVAAVVLMLGVAVGWFFRMGSWAASVPARDGAAPLAAEALRARLLALGGGGATVQPHADGRIAIGFTLADARWLDLSGANRRRRVHRLLLRLDAAARTVWVTEQWSEFDARVGAGGAQLRWHSAVGLKLFERSHTVQAGAVLGPDGRPTGELLQRERVDLQALKAPCIATVTGAGWHWRPVMLDVSGLRRGGAGRA